MYAKIRFFWGALVLGSIIAVIMIPFIHIFPRHKASIMHYLNKIILKLIGARVQTVGFRDAKANLFIMNHQSIIDIVLMEAIEDVNWRWVAKKELFNMPIYGHLLKGGDMIEVDRENKAGLIKLIKDARESIEIKKRSVAIFPEGSRAKGQELLSFKAGTRFIANKLQMRVQPIVILGSKWILDEHMKTAHSGQLKVIYLPAFDVKDAPKDWYKQTASLMQDTIDKEYQEYHIKR